MSQVHLEVPKHVSRGPCHSLSQFELILGSLWESAKNHPFGPCALCIKEPNRCGLRLVGAVPGVPEANESA